MLDHIES